MLINALKKYAAELKEEGKGEGGREGGHVIYVSIF